MRNYRDYLPRICCVLALLGLGIAFVRESLPPVLVPQVPPLLTNAHLSAADLAFGRHQVDQMMKDRSIMAEEVKKGDLVYQWAVRQFAGEAMGYHIAWSSATPASQGSSLSTADIFHRKITIRECYGEGEMKGYYLSAEQLWQCAVFELYNMSQTARFADIDQKAFEGKISRQQFILETAHIEYGTLQKEKLFYSHLWLPLAKKKSHKTTPEIWFMDESDTYEAWIGHYHSNDAYPYGDYGTVYDQYIAPHIKR